MAEGNSVIASDVKLKRFLYTSTEHSRFVTGNVDRLNYYIPENVTCVSEYLRSANPETLLNIIEIVHSEGLLPRRESVFFLLALAVTTATTHTFKNQVYRTLVTLIKDCKDLCSFIKYYTKQQKKFGSGVNKLIGRYYNCKEPMKLLEEVTSVNGYHRWTHKDLLKLSHFKWESLSTAVIVVYVLFGMKKAELVADGNESVSNILTYLKKIEELKRTEDEKRVIELIPELHCTLQRVPSIYHHSISVWEALIPELPIRELITYLPRLYKAGFLKSNTSFQNKIIECLTNSDKIQESQIHPVEIFIGLRNFEKGGKPMDPKYKAYVETLAKEVGDALKHNEPPKCPNVVSALHKAMQISFQNPQPWSRKIMITIDITSKMHLPCLNNKNLSCLDAATILTLSILRVERDVTVAVFNDTKVKIVNLERNATFNQALSKIKECTSSYCLPSLPFDWALNKKKPIDVFINFLYYHHWFNLIPIEKRTTEKPISNLKTYRKAMALPHAKLISFSLSSPHLSIADGSPNILDIGGFDKDVPLVIEAFSKGLF